MVWDRVYVVALLCDDDPGDLYALGGAILESPPAGCAAAGGIAATLMTEDGSQVGACTTAAGTCAVDVPREATVTAMAGPTTVPPGYTLRENPVEVRTETTGIRYHRAIFVGLPSGQSGDDDDSDNATGGATTLPSTGTGVTASGAWLGGSSLVAALLVLFGVAFGGCRGLVASPLRHRLIAALVARSPRSRRPTPPVWRL